VKASIVFWLVAALTAAACAAGESESASPSAPRPVPATANIFGAGYNDAPAPGGGGGGTAPPGWRLPAGEGRVVTFPSITGSVTPLSGSSPYNGPEGDHGANGFGPSDFESLRGISGIIDSKNRMFLVGVFVGDGEPPLPAPPRLDFTEKERFDTLAPVLGQTFFIGDGSGRRYDVPKSATRLYVAFADAYPYARQAGYYYNNAGRLEVVATGVLDGAGTALDNAAPELYVARNDAVTAPRGKKRARVRFSVLAADAVDGDLPVACTPASGSFFRVGRTKVTCSATDTSGNTGQKQFVVTVKKARGR
jgi:HYR domain-containing protein